MKYLSPGTTGEPKAAILTHKGVMYFAASYYATTAIVKIKLKFKQPKTKALMMNLTLL